MSKSLKEAFVYIAVKTYISCSVIIFFLNHSIYIGLSFTIFRPTFPFYILSPTCRP